MKGDDFRGSAEALLRAAGASTYVGVDASPFAIEEARRAVDLRYPAGGASGRRPTTLSTVSFRGVSSPIA